MSKEARRVTVAAAAGEPWQRTACLIAAVAGCLCSKGRIAACRACGGGCCSANQSTSEHVRAKCWQAMYRSTWTWMSCRLLAADAISCAAAVM